MSLSVRTGLGDRGLSFCPVTRSMLPKHHPCFEFYGSLDEAAAALGLAKAECSPYAVELDGVERALHYAGFAFSGSYTLPEALLDHYAYEIEKLKREVEVPNRFLLTPACRCPASLALARASVRRTERAFWAAATLFRERGLEITQAGRIGRLLNILSDYLYMLYLHSIERYGCKKRYVELP